MSAREFLTDPLILARLAEQAARDEAHQFRLLADNVPVAIAYYESAGFTCQYANRGYAQTFGWNEQSIIGHTVADVIGEEAARFIQPQVDQVLKQRTPAMYERQLATAAGLRFIEVHLLPHLDREGKPMGAFVLISDISKHRLAERAVRESEERLAKFMQASAEGIVFHKGGLITDANPPILALTGYTIDEMVGRHVFEFIAPEHVSRVQTVMGAGQELAYELEILDRQRRRIPVEFIVRTMERHGERLRMTIVRDIRDRRAAQAHIRHLAHHDALTGLPNRTAFMERASALLAEGQRDDQTLAMLFIDLDHFKRVNDSLGHIAGDSLLQTIAARLSASLRTGDLVARFGGDEFMVLLPGDLPRADVEAVASKLLAAVEAPLELHNTSISVSPTIGVALFPRDGSTPVELIKHADTAMYYAKSRGRATCEFFEPEMESEAYAALLMEGDLARAIERGEFELHFQPQLRLIDNAIVGAEALIRWRHPVRGLLLPDAFIPVAEERRLMLPIGQWVMREAARCARRWRDAGLAALPVAVNLSTLQFQSPRFVESVEQVLLQERALGTHLELELTERMLMDDMPAVRRMLHRLKLLGVRIAVDDFGTGYTSLVHLKDLPIDRVKIDRAFVKDLPGNAGCAAIARSIIQLAHGLGMEVVAEGVELPAQRAWLDEHGCDHLQGYVLARAMPAAQFEAWLKSRAAASGSATS